MISEYIQAPFGAVRVDTTDEGVVGVSLLTHADSEGISFQSLQSDWAKRIAAYLDDPQTSLDDVPLVLEGTKHRIKCWSALCGIPVGSVQTYGEVAEKIGSSPRAVGQACRHNPIPIIVPCHRVTGKKNTGGFMGQSAGGQIDIKHWLLNHEYRLFS